MEGEDYMISFNLEKKEDEELDAMEFAVKYYYENNETKKKVEKEVKKHGATIKENLEVGDSATYPAVGLKASLTAKKSTYLLAAKLEAKLESLKGIVPGVEECFVTTVTVDQNKVGELIAAGLLDPTLLEECTEEKVTGALYVKPIK